MGRVDVEVRKGSVGCDVWVVGVLGSPRDDGSRMFPKFVFGSFFQSFGVSLSGDYFLGGLGMDGTRFFSSKWGWAAP
jgi:hypothetical protein